MGCFQNCNDLWFKFESVYGNACDLLAERNRDCTIVDVGCHNLPYLHEIKRHLLNRHHIRCRTIGIDVDIYDIEVDRFINKEISKVDMPDIADVVTSRYVFVICYTEKQFRNTVRASANMLKDDGVMITDLEGCETPKPILGVTDMNRFPRVMTKKDALEHADMCFRQCYEKCPHGICGPNMSRADVKKYLKL